LFKGVRKLFASSDSDSPSGRYTLPFRSDVTSPTRSDTLWRDGGGVRWLRYGLLLEFVKMAMNVASEKVWMEMREEFSVNLLLALFLYAIMCL
jgi:hypothetical protein